MSEQPIEQLMNDGIRPGPRSRRHSRGRDRRAHAVLDEAIHLLGQRGFTAADEEAIDLLDTAGAIGQSDGGRVRLRAGFLRKALCRVPSAFNLFDREGRKVRTLAGGIGRPQEGALHATLAEADAVVEDRDRSPRAPTVAEVPDLAASLARVREFDILGCTPCPSGIPRPLGEIYRLYWGILNSSRPHLLRPRHTESLSGLQNLLSALRGSDQDAENKPLIIVEALAIEPLEWDRPACRILIDCARHGIPVAPVPVAPVLATAESVAPVSATAAAATPVLRSAAPALPQGMKKPRPSRAPEAWALETVATALAGLLIHQLARDQAPLLWGLPLIQPFTQSPEFTDAWRLCLAAGEQLGLPSLATSAAHPHPRPGAREEPPGPLPEFPDDAIALWAVQAELCGAAVVAWGGQSGGGNHLSHRGLERGAALIPEIRRAGALLTEATGLGRKAVARAAGERARPHARPRVTSETREALAAVVRQERSRHDVGDLPLRLDEEP